MKSHRFLIDEQYVESEKWKCSKSPTKAHWWMVGTYTMTCKYCDETRELLQHPIKFNWFRHA